MPYFVVLLSSQEHAHDVCAGMIYCSVMYDSKLRMIFGIANIVVSRVNFKSL